MVDYAQLRKKFKPRKTVPQRAATKAAVKAIAPEAENQRRMSEHRVVHRVLAHFVGIQSGC